MVFQLALTSDMVVPTTAGTDVTYFGFAPLIGLIRFGFPFIAGFVFVRVVRLASIRLAVVRVLVIPGPSTANFSGGCQEKANLCSLSGCSV